MQMRMYLYSHLQCLHTFSYVLYGDIHHIFRQKGLSPELVFFHLNDAAHLAPRVLAAADEIQDSTDRSSV